MGNVSGIRKSLRSAFSRSLTFSQLRGNFAWLKLDQPRDEFAKERPGDNRRSSDTALIEILDGYRFKVVRRFKAKDARIEVELAIQRTLDVLGPAKPVLLTFED